MTNDQVMREEYRELQEFTKKLKSLCDARNLPFDIVFDTATNNWTVEISSLIPMEGFKRICRGVHLNAVVNAAVIHMEKLG